MCFKRRRRKAVHYKARDTDSAGPGNQLLSCALYIAWTATFFEKYCSEFDVSVIALSFTDKGLSCAILKMRLMSAQHELYHLDHR